MTSGRIRNGELRADKSASVLKECVRLCLFRKYSSTMKVRLKLEARGDAFLLPLNSQFITASFQLLHLVA